LWAADSINLGAFTLSAAVTGKMNWFQSLDRTSLSEETIPQETTQGMTVSTLTHGYYIGRYGQSSPQVGDVEVTYSSVPEQIVSLVAAQTGTAFGSFTTSSGRTLLLVEAGTVSAAEMFVHANEQVTEITWIIRLVGFLILWAALHNLAAPLATFANILPILGSLVEGVTCLLSGLVAVVISSVTVAVAWLFYRPLISIALLGVAGGAVFYLYKNNREQRFTAVAPVVQAEVIGQDLELQEGSFSDTK
jgi:hypothetical protein